METTSVPPTPNSSTGAFQPSVLGDPPAGAAFDAAHETPSDANDVEPSAKVLFGIQDLEHLQKSRLDKGNHISKRKGC